jgi:peptidoglycan/LPS O-acetylase OafA/YrhL
MQGLFRFVLALMVLWSHSMLKFFPELSGWFPMLQLGSVAVSSFFVLSGYLMAEAIVNWYADRLPNFLVNRYLRIGPPLLIAALVSIAIHFTVLRAGTMIVGFEAIPQGAISNGNAILALLAPIFPLDVVVAKAFSIAPDPYYQFVRYSWAIFTELIFYWVLFLYAAAARLVGQRLAGMVFLSAAFAMFAGGTMNYGGYLSGTLIGEYIARIPFVFHMQWTPHFLVGVLVSACARVHWRGHALNGILLAAGVAAIVQLGLYAHTSAEGALVVVLLYALTLGAGFRLILSDRHQYSIGPLRLDRTLDRRFGNLSYPVYINHYALALALLWGVYVFNVDVTSFPAYARVVAFVFFNLIIVFSAALLIRITDVVTDRLRDRIRGVAL